MIDFTFLKTVQELFAASENILLTGAMVLIVVLAFAVRWIWTKYDQLRTEAAEEIRKLQGQLTTLNQEYSESNNRSAETLDKIADTILKLATLTAKK